MIGRLTWVGVLTVLAAACVEPTDPGDPRFGQLRILPVFTAGEAPEDLRLMVDSLRVEIMRSGGGAPLVDTVTAYVADETLDWVLSLTRDEEVLQVRLELVDADGPLYQGDDAPVVRVGTLGSGDVRAVNVAYIGPARAMAVSVSPESATLNAVGASTELTATAFDGDGNAMPDKIFDWSSSAFEVATVDAGGRVTAVGDGVAGISATVDGLSATATVTIALVVPPVATATITADPAELEANGTDASAITVRLFDASGTSLTESGGTLTLATTLGTLTAVVDHDDGTYTADLRSTEPGTALVTGTLGGEPIDDAAEVLFTPSGARAASARMRAVPTWVEANATDASVIEVQLFDADGNPLGQSGGTVALATTLGSLTAVVDHGDGRYTAELRSPDEGTAVVTGALNGETIHDSAEVLFTPIGSPGVIPRMSAVPVEVEANGTDASVIEVRLFDPTGSPLKESGGTVTLATTLGTLTTVVDHDDGTYTADLRSTEPGTALVTGTLGGEPIDDAAEVLFTPSGGSAASARMRAVPTWVEANATDASVIEVQLFDADGNPLGQSGGTVALATTLGSLTAVVDHGDGRYTAELRSPDEGTAVVTGALNGETIHDSAEVLFTPIGSPGVIPRMSAVPVEVEANGTDASVIEVRLFDPTGSPLKESGGTVTLATTLGTLTAVVDHDDGTYTADLRSTEPGTALVTGTLGGEPIDDDAEVLFTPSGGSAASARMRAVPTWVEANATDASVIEVRLFDADGNPLGQSGGTVALATTLGSLTAVVDHGDGWYTAELRSPDEGTAVVTGALNGETIHDSAEVLFTPIGSPAVIPRMRAVPVEVEANGTDASVIEVRLFDPTGSPLKESGGTVTLATTLGTLTAVVDHDDGWYTAELRSTDAGTAVVTGTFDGAPIEETAKVRFTAGHSS